MKKNETFSLPQVQDTVNAPDVDTFKKLLDEDLLN